MNFYSKALVFIFSATLYSCPPQGKGILGQSQALSTIVDSKTKSAPFAYDFVADTISYNSCVALNIAGSPVHGLKIGVNEGFVDPNTTAVKAGLRLRTDFLQYVGQNFSPQYPSKTVTSAQIQNILAGSDKNKTSYLQFSVRKRSDLSNVVDLISPGSNSTTTIPQAGRDVVPIYKELFSGYTAYLLSKDVQFNSSGGVLAAGPRIYNLSDSSDPIAIEGSFGFNQTEDQSFPASSSSGFKESALGAAEYYSDYVRKKFMSSSSDQYLLTAIFAGINSVDASATSNIATPIRPSTTDKTKAYGRSYQLRFSSKSPGKAGWANNLLTSVVETDLSNGTISADPWVCENFLIMKTEEWNNKKVNKATCSPLQAADLTAARQLQVKKIRRHYSPSNWNIGLFVPADTDPTMSRTTLQMCLTPINSSCYLPTTGILDDAASASVDVGINYDTSKECYLTAYNALGYNYSVGTDDDRRKLGRCPQYASICVRNSTNY